MLSSVSEKPECQSTWHVVGNKGSWLQGRDRALGHQSSANDRAGAIIALSRSVRLSLQVLILARKGYLLYKTRSYPVDDDSSINNNGKSSCSR